MHRIIANIPFHICGKGISICFIFFALVCNRFLHANSSTWFAAAFSGFERIIGPMVATAHMLRPIADLLRVIHRTLLADHSNFYLTRVSHFGLNLM